MKIPIKTPMKMTTDGGELLLAINLQEKYLSKWQICNNQVS